MTLLGPSGSGKTTTLGLIAGFTDLTEGRLAVDDRDVSSIPMHKRGIGVVFQNYALFPHMTVADNVGFPLRQRRAKKTEIAARVAEALDTVHMSDLGGRYPGELSGGQQQRVAFARAIVFRPRVLLMDEPLGALDKKLREWLQLEIRRIHSEVGSTFVYVTHDQDEALSMSDRITVFNEGRIEQVGTPAELYNAPRSLFVGQFVGESTTLSGTVAGATGAVVEVRGESTWRAPASSEVTDGDEVALLVRPEHIRLVPREGQSQGSGVNRADVTVTDYTYLGAGYKCSFRLADGTAGVLRMPQNGELPVAVGERGTVEWNIEHGVVLPKR
jgi:putative spermidine/putrescine transport system ATP-binding protein